MARSGIEPGVGRVGRAPAHNRVGKKAGAGGVVLANAAPRAGARGRRIAGDGGVVEGHGAVVHVVDARAKTSRVSKQGRVVEVERARVVVERAVVGGGIA